MVKLTDIQTNIQISLVQAILHNNLQEVQNIFKDNEDSNIQKILRLEWTLNELRKESRPGKLPPWPLIEPYYYPQI